MDDHGPGAGGDDGHVAVADGGVALSGEAVAVRQAVLERGRRERGPLGTGQLLDAFPVRRVAHAQVGLDEAGEVVLWLGRGRNARRSGAAMATPSVVMRMRVAPRGWSQGGASWWVRPALREMGVGECHAGRSGLGRVKTTAHCEERAQRATRQSRCEQERRPLDRLERAPLDAPGLPRPLRGPLAMSRVGQLV